MKIVCISDTHNHKPKLPPDGDLLIHSGDLTMQGSKDEVRKGIDWLSDLAKHKYEHGVLLIPGNHDFYFEPDAPHLPKTKFGRTIERNAKAAREMCGNANVQLLMDEATEVAGVKIYGSPVSPWFHDWAFNVQRNVIGQVWEKIPDNTQLLITHGPPYGLGDLCRGGNVGCQALLERIKLLKDLKVHVFGHIHEGAGEHWFNNKLFVNASVLDGYYNGYNEIITVNWPDLKIEKFPDREI